jgi:hypothetical protein
VRAFETLDDGGLFSCQQGTAMRAGGMSCGKRDLLDNTKHPISTVLTNRTIIECRTGSILIVNSIESLSSVHY